MLLIAIDTSGRNGSVALCRGDENSFTTLQVMTVEGGTYSARLMPVIAELLANQHLTKEQIDGFVVVAGPGSFTGLRVGLATVKGLCEVLQKPLVAVSMLEAVAVVRGPHDGRVAVALDAGRGEVYVGEFMIAESRASVVREYIAKLEEFAGEARVTVRESRCKGSGRVSCAGIGCTAGGAGSRRRRWAVWLDEVHGRRVCRCCHTRRELYSPV